MKQCYLGVLIALLLNIQVLPVLAQETAGAAKPALEAATFSEITIYRSDRCGCCTRWGERLEAAGFTIKDVVVEDMDGLKQANGITPELSSCHTGVVADYVVEGHVPPDSIKRMLRERPKIRGLTAPGMPMGSPGMETEGVQAEAFDVLAIANDGTTTVFDRISPESSH